MISFEVNSVRFIIVIDIIFNNKMAFLFVLKIYYFIKGVTISTKLIILCPLFASL
jgi:hypothetical protein